ncbi:hypothetical protein Tco_0889746 [Tanacetum coccineum]
MPVAKSPYHLAPSEMQELSEQLQELQDEGVKDKILATPIETSKVENAPAEMLHDLDQQMEKRADDGCTLWIKLYSKYEFEIHYHPGRENVVIDALRKKEQVKPRRGMMRTVVMDEAHASRRKPLEFEVGDRVMLKVSPWKGDIRFGKKCKLAPRYVGPFEILERIGPVAYRLRLPEELSGAKLLAVRYLVKVSWNSKGNFELTWVWEDYLKDKYPRLIVWLVKPLVLTYESVVMYGLCVFMRYVDYVRVGNQSIERDRLIGIGLVMDLVKFLSFTFGGKEMTFVVLAFLR